MKKILIATHGHMASGVKSVAKILLRDDSAITAVDCYVDESDFTPKVQEWIDGIDPEDDAVIFTDLKGGSVCNKIAGMHPEKRGIVHVTGFNLALVLECLITADPITPEFIDAGIQGATALMERVVLEEEAAEDESDDYFFA